MFLRLVSFFPLPCQMLQVTCRRAGRHLSPHLPKGGAHEALLRWKGHQLDLPLGARASWQCFALGGALLKGTCRSVRAVPYPRWRSPCARGVWSTGSCSARPDAWDLKAEESPWYFYYKEKYHCRRSRNVKGMRLLLSMRQILSFTCSFPK